MILALDLAKQTGWCCGDGRGLPRSGARKFTEFDRGLAAGFVAFRGWLVSVLSNFEPGIVVFEAPILPSATRPETVRRLHGMAALVEMIAHEESRRCIEANNQSAKKFFAGSGRAGKADMVRSACARGFRVESHDEADACAIWLQAIDRRDPELARRFTPAFAGTPLGDAA